VKALILGASAGVGRALSKALAARGNELLLVASDSRDLEAQARYLRLIYDVHVETVVADAGRPTECLNSIQLAANKFGEIEGFFFPIGMSRTDDRGTLSFFELQSLFDANLLIVVGLISSFLPSLLVSNRGNIVGFGSVAAIRGRRANVVYAAAKRGLESYFESLRHITFHTNVQVQYYKLGYVSTQQSFGKHLLFPQVEPQKVANLVVQNLGGGQGTIYFPRFWSVIAHLTSLIPWQIFARLDF
jgi:short-subunit dehydrogenase